MRGLMSKKILISWVLRSRLLNVKVNSERSVSLIVDVSKEHVTSIGVFGLENCVRANIDIATIARTARMIIIIKDENPDFLRLNIITSMIQVYEKDISNFKLLIQLLDQNKIGVLELIMSLNLEANIYG